MVRDSLNVTEESSSALLVGLEGLHSEGFLWCACSCRFGKHTKHESIRSTASHKVANFKLFLFTCEPCLLAKRSRGSANQ